MYLIQTPRIQEPAVNLAIEEFAVRHLDIQNDYLFLYINKPSIVIGKNQNPFCEINLAYARQNSINFYRRISGGGAVYHDQGNLNFTYITQYSKETFNTYHKFLQPIKSYLNSYGLGIKINERNDLVLKDKKISGNAQFTSRNRLLCHGTLLFNADLSIISKILKPEIFEIHSQSTRSKRSKVTNINQHLDEKISMETFKKNIESEILKAYSNQGVYEFTDVQWQDIYSLAKSKFSTFEWNTGRTPGFKLKIENPPQKYKALVEINKGIIQKIEILEDTKGILSTIKNLIIDIIYSKEALLSALTQDKPEKDQNIVRSLYPFY